MSDDLYCSKCGEKLDQWDTMQNFVLKCPIGYGSKYDGEHLHINFCCDCMDELIEECAITPLQRTA